jgi:DNA-3-methyladenine glycosylase II
MNITVYPRPPYDFTLSTHIFSNGDPQIRRAENNRFWQVIRVGQKLVLAEVISNGTIDDPAVNINLRTDKTLRQGETEQAGELISRILNLNDDLTQFYNEIRNDLPMYALTEHLYGLKVPTTPSLFEALIASIIEQQISLAVAHTLETRLVKKFGSPLKVGERIYYCYPVPGEIASADPAQIRDCGLSNRKGEYIRDIALRMVKGDLDLENFGKIRNNDLLIETLCKLRGVGKWTAELTILRGLHRLDAVPADDLGLRRAISERYFHGRKINGEEARRIAERWGEYRGLASFYLLIGDQMRI